MCMAKFPCPKCEWAAHICISNHTQSYMAIPYICEQLTNECISLVRSSDNITKASYLGDLDPSGLAVEIYFSVGHR